MSAKNRSLSMLGDLALFAFATGFASAAYDPNWTKAQCDAYSYHGLYETYYSGTGGDRGWIDNDIEDGYPTEGVDCSAYVARCLALPSYVAEGTARSQPYSTANFYPGVLNTVQVGSVDSLQQWDLWVWRADSGGPGDPGTGHMGLFKEYSGSYIITREAQDHQAGYDILEKSRSKQNLVDYNTRFWRRKDWGSGTPPSNDNCSSATLLTSNTSCSYTAGSVLNATASGLSKPSCDRASAPNMFDVWYRFVATSSSQTVTVVPSTSVGDPVVSVYGSCSGSFVGCGDSAPEGGTESLPLVGLTVGNTYYVRVYDYGSVEPVGSDADFQICVTGTTPSCTNPGAPGAPTLSNVQSTSLTVSWSDVANEVGYQVQRCQGSGCSLFANVGSQLAAGTTSYGDSGLSASTIYRYRVVAEAATGCSDQTGSSSSDVTTSSSCTDPGAPGAPTFSNVQSTSLTVSWSDVANEVGYQVQRCQGSGCSSFANVGSQLAAGATSYGDSGLTASTIYRYRVVAKAATGCSDQTGSSSSDVTTSSSCSNPGAPAAPTFSNVQNTSLTVSWSDVANEVGYQVQRCQGSGCTSFANVGSQLAAGTTSYNDTGLTASTTYRYQVVAKAATGCSDQTGSSSSDVTTNTSSGCVFTQQGPKLVGTGSVGTAQQGRSVSVSSDGNTAVVGGSNDNGQAGAAWVWTRNGGVWTPQTKLVGSGAVGNAQQGFSVALSADGNTSIVGGPYDNSDVGAAWVWTRNGGVWTPQTELVGTGVVGNSRQGWSVSLSADGNTALVGGYLDNSGVGAAWVWTRSGGAWTQQGPKLVAPDTMGNALQGWSVSLSGDGNTAIVGGPYDNRDGSGYGPGAAWIWTRSGGAWTKQTKLFGSGAVGYAQQGYSVSISADGDTAIVGGFMDNNFVGAAWVWTRSGSTWTQQAKVVVGTANQGSSVSLSADGNTAIIGAQGDNSGAGAAWVWTRSGGVWAPQDKLLGSGAVGNAYQGSSVSISGDGNTALVGGENDNSGAGAAWVFAACVPLNPETLTVSKPGTGTGTVSSDLPGVVCGTTCSAAFSSGAVVTLTAAADAGSSFTAWGGDCTGSGVCQVTMSQARYVTATFTSQVSCGSSVSGTLSTTDSTAGHRWPSYYTDIYQLNGVAGQTVTINMTSAFDTYLYLVNPAGTVETANDDGPGGTLNSVIVYTLPSTGLWRIEATSYGSGVTGAYNLSLGCIPPGNRFVPIPPCRVLDTRDPSGAPILDAGSRRVFAVAGACGIPSGARAIVANLTVVGAGAPGELKVIGGHLTSTTTSSISFPVFRARANNAVFQLAADGSGTISVINNSTGSVHFILDVSGYFQ
jgi:hypothetical protein